MASFNTAPNQIHKVRTKAWTKPVVARVLQIKLFPADVYHRPTWTLRYVILTQSVVSVNTPGEKIRRGYFIKASVQKDWFGTTYDFIKCTKRVSGCSIAYTLSK